ncbi:hypothetical protein K2Z84_16055 [Candidatus Binatia bacterium]|jgi:hypothetical protein|nr:hypothetical protein [Candidatus Binatia bacterium]
MNHETTTSGRERGRRRRALVLGATVFAVAFGALAVLAHAAKDPGVVCSAVKKKAAVKRYDGELKCYVSAMQKGVAVDAKCLAKAQDQFGDAFAKAESKGGCATVGDAAGIAALIDGQLAALNAALPFANALVCDVGSAGESECNTCLNCSLEAGKPCNAAYDACQGDAECVAFWNCVTPCADEACVQTCVVNHTDGARLYNAMLSCAIGSCPVTCSN